MKTWIVKLKIKATDTAVANGFDPCPDNDNHILNVLDRVLPPEFYEDGVEIETEMMEAPDYNEIHALQDEETQPAD